MNADAVVVLTTVPTEEQAVTLARKIIESKLAACVQVLPPMKSFYWWENDVQVDSEHLLLIKTLADKYDELEKFIQTNHSYDVPEIVAFKASDAAENYLDWMKNYLR